MVRENRITFSVNDDEKDILTKKAEIVHLRLNDYCRWSLFNHIELEAEIKKLREENARLRHNQHSASVLHPPSSSSNHSDKAIWDKFEKDKKTKAEKTIQSIDPFLKEKEVSHGNFMTHILGELKKKLNSKKPLQKIPEEELEAIKAAKEARKIEINAELKAIKSAIK